MYGLTDNIVAGPAGHTTAAPAGSFMVGPSGNVTPVPAGHTPVYPVTQSIPYIGGGYVPIDTTPARIPYAASAGGGMSYQAGSTNAPIPGPSASVTYSPATGGGMSYSSGGGGSVGGGGGYIGGGGGGGGGGYVGGGGGGGGGGGISMVSGGGGISGGGGGGGGGVSASSANVSPGASSNPGAGASIQGGGMSYVAYGGAGNPPMELRVGQAMTQATAGMAPTPGTSAFITELTTGHVVPSPVGYVQPPRASHFHGPRNSHVAHHPQTTISHVVNENSYEPYKASTVWEPRQPAPSLPFLAADYVKPSAYEVPHVIFPDEHPVGIALVEANVRPNNTYTEVNNQTLALDLSQTSNPTVQHFSSEERNLVLDNSITRNLDYSYPENRESSVSMDLSQTVNADNSVFVDRSVQNTTELPARVLNMVFADAPAVAPSAVVMGGPIMARVA